MTCCWRGEKGLIRVCRNYEADYSPVGRFQIFGPVHDDVQLPADRLLFGGFDHHEMAVSCDIKFARTAGLS